LDLAAAGMLREDAYRLVQGHALRSWQDESNFEQEIQQDSEITRYLTQAQLRQTFDVRRQLRNVDAIFARVFDDIPSSKG
jgi:adenylosuccinate lyase